MPSNNYIYKMSNAGGMSTLTRYTDMLAGNAAYVPIFGAYDSIATTTVGAGGAASVSFSSIPSTYTHLQIRAFGIGSSYSYFSIKVNSDTGTNYAYHQLTGDGASATAGAGSSTTTMFIGQGSASATNGAVSITDLLDYTNTNKYKTFRTLSGYDSNGSGGIWFRSGLWMNTAAITQIDLIAVSGFAQYSSFALYGIKGA